MAKLILTGTLVSMVTLAAMFLYLDRRQERIFQDLMKNQAKGIFKQVVITRKWVADHGGIFVEKLPWVKANPYLADGIMEDTVGRVFVKENPAMVTRALSEYAKKHGSYWFNITSLNLVNPENAPDGFESAALERFRQGVSNEEYGITEIEGEKYYRYIAPLYIDEGCLKCHSQHGYDFGDIRGGISITIPIEAFYDFLSRERVKVGLLSLGVALALMLGLYISLHRVLVVPIRRVRDFAVAWREGALPETVSETQRPIDPDQLPEGDELGDLFVELSRLHATVTSNERMLESRVMQATEELKDLNQQLAEARDRYRETSLKKSEFIAGLSHELRTPLTSLKGALSYITSRIEEERPEPAELAPFVDIIDRNMGRLVKLVEDTLDLEKIEAGYIELHRSKVDMTALFQEVAQEFSDKARKQAVALEISASGPLMVVADRDRIRQVLDNLVLNALRHSPGETAITMEGRHSGDKIVSCVKDHGTGISDGDRGKVFDRFYKGSKDGTGLGLAISRGIVEEHGGEIWVGDNDRQGATLCFSLPSAPLRAEPGERGESETED